MLVTSSTSKGQLPFKRKQRQKKKPQLLIRLSILIVGVSCFMLYCYVTGNAYMAGIDLGGGLESSIEEERVLLEVPDPLSSIDMFQYSEDWVGRYLLESHLNKNSSDYNECRDKNAGTEGQKEICIGYGGDACKKIPPKDAWYGIIIILLSLLYLFIGIAIVCDELFVPALEIVAEDLELSNDVAGATLMAAGGSAPELATSFVGTFKRSDVGFGTIVGSAVFNVLFVIGMCVMFTPEKYAPLALTWWPLFRDCTYYILTLSTLAIFMSDGEITWWESLIQLFMYFGYVGMMSKSSELEQWITAKIAGINTPTSAVSPAATNEKNEMDESIEMGSKSVGENEAKAADTPDASSGKDGGASFNKPSTFRAGILQLMTSKLPLTETVGIAFVSQIKGDVNVVFDRIDANKNGEIDLNELKQCLLELGTPEEELSDEAVKGIMNDIDKNGNGFANKADFTVWYTRNETRLRNQTREVFEKYATAEGSDGNKNTIRKSKIYEFMAELGHNDSDAVKEQMQETMDKITSERMTYEEFTEWYFNSMFWEQEKATAEQAADAQESMWQSIQSGFGEFGEMPISAKSSFIILLPLQLLCCLIPDCRTPGAEKLAPFTLLASIIMIAFFAIIMVEFAETFGQTLGIPDVVMGLTILAAGTSVPDLLSSVIVAQQGEGDMAVSSSIGSNIFDVAFGLPLPWLTFNIVIAASDCLCWVEVSGDSNSLMISLLTLLAMVAAIVVIIHYCEWKMTKPLGWSMFFLYFCYLAFALLMTPPGEYKSASCSPFKPLG